MSITRVITEVAELTKIGRNIFDAQSVDDMDKVQQDLHSIMERVPRNRDEHLEHAYQMYLQEFSQGPEEEEFLSARALVQHFSSRPVNLASHDLGVDVESQLSLAQLMASLGLQDKTVLPFMNRIMNKLPWATWTAGLTVSQVYTQLTKGNKADLAGTPLESNWVPARLRPHQVAGIHAVLNLMTKPAPRGVLIADDVGIGKTCQAAGVLAMMIHSTEQKEQTGLKLPALRGPTVIACPKSLLQNWDNELNVWLTGVEVFKYDVPVVSRPTFFDQSLPWHLSKTPLHRRVILVSETTLSRDAGMDFESAPGHPPRLYPGAENKHDLLGHFRGAGSIGLVIIDEAHDYRTRKRNYDAAVYLAECAVGVIALTATPVFTQSSVRSFYYP
jgi:hypothetical protein